jgi:hypothetical protein
MSHKVSTFNVGRVRGKGESRVRKEVVLAILISAAVVLVAASVWALMSMARPAVASGVAAGVEASSARWAALGAHYTRDYEAIAAVSSARWNALSDYYRTRVAAGVEASSARWAALGAHYARDFEAIAAVSSARWSALGDCYLARYEAAAATSSARYQALAEWYARRVAQGE